MKPKVIAFYLPAFHRIAENDAAWGEGFTEWDLVRACPTAHKPLLGYYDLSQPEMRKIQTDLAAKYGIYGFCYYHFWLQGRPIFGRPIENALASHDNHPFCLCWANENWTRRWDGSVNEIIITQSYNDDWKVHWQYLERIFNDPRYIRIGDRPILLAYQGKNIPPPRRDFLKSKGVFLISCATRHQGNLDNMGMFEAVYEFAPFNTNNIEVECDKLADLIINCPRAHKIQFPGAYPAWNNAPRCIRDRQPYCVTGTTPEKFGKLLKAKAAQLEGLPEPFLFINAWNEWGEGAYLEPDDVHGYSYLEQVASLIS